MTILSLKDFMMKHNLNDDTMSESDLRKFIVLLFIPEIRKHHPIKGL